MSVFIKANIKFTLDLIIPYIKLYRRRHNGLYYTKTSSLSTLNDHTQAHHTRQYSSEKWSARRRDLYLTTHNTQKIHPCPRRDSNSQFQQSSGSRPLALDRAITRMTVGIRQPFPNYRTIWTWIVDFTRQLLYSRRESCLSSLDRSRDEPHIRSKSLWRKK